jgi:hypothetical protein
MFRAHAAMLAGNLNSLANHINAMAISGQGGTRISQSQAQQYVTQASRLVNSFAQSMGRTGGMYGAADMNTTDTNDANMTSGWGSRSDSSGKSTWSRNRGGGMYGAATGASITADLQSASSLMKNMADSLSSNNAQSLRDLGTIVNNIAQIKTNLTGAGTSSGGQIGASDMNDMSTGRDTTGTDTSTYDANTSGGGSGSW